MAVPDYDAAKGDPVSKQVTIGGGRSDPVVNGFSVTDPLDNSTSEGYDQDLNTFDPVQFLSMSAADVTAENISASGTIDSPQINGAVLAVNNIELPYAGGIKFDYGVGTIGTIVMNATGGNQFIDFKLMDAGFALTNAGVNGNVDVEVCVDRGDGVDNIFLNNISTIDAGGAEVIGVASFTNTNIAGTINSTGVAIFDDQTSCIGGLWTTGVLYKRDVVVLAVGAFQYSRASQVVTSEAGVADDLTDITSAVSDLLTIGKRVTIWATESHTITIKNSGNIVTTSGADVVIDTQTKNATFEYVPVAAGYKWAQVV